MKKWTSLFCLLIVLVLLLGLVPTGAAAEDAADPTLHTEGNQLVNGSGEAVRLLGLNIPYMTWSDQNETKVMEVLDISLDEWDSNAIRLGVTPELWFGKKAESYRKTADRLIEKVAALGKSGGDGNAPER